MAQETNQTQVPMLCATGCGFYGNPRTNGMCSVCYKDLMQRQNSNGRVSPQVCSAIMLDLFVIIHLEGKLWGTNQGSTTVSIAPSGMSSIGDSLPTQCSEGTTIDVPPAVSPTATALEQSSQTLLSQASLTHSEEEDSSGDKIGLKTEELQAVSSFTDKCAGCETVTVCTSSFFQSLSLVMQVVEGDEWFKLNGKTTLIQGNIEIECVHTFTSAVLWCFHETNIILGFHLASASDDSDQASSEGQDKSPEKPKQKKNRCFLCRKKVGLTGFDCRCGNLFCGVHRYSDIHNCTFDYKADAAEKIRKENPVVVGEKIQKI
ncbi:ZFAN6 protein, partial [Amia calva]|nr:ZFAN6 protein [Amia calva]